MPDLHDRFRSLDGIVVPDLWDDVEERAATHATTVGPVGPRNGRAAATPRPWTRRSSAGLALFLGLVALLIALLAGLFVSGGGRSRPAPLLFETYVGAGGTGQLYAVDADGAKPRLILGSASTRVHVSPDGRYAYFSSDDGLGIARTDGSGSTTIAGSAGTEGGREYEVVWSPDSTAVAFIAGEPDRQRLAIVGIDGRSRREIDLPAGQQFVIAWSPDSRRMAVVDWGGCDPVPSRSYVVDTRTGTIREIGDRLSARTIPAWSPDGRSFAAIVADWSPPQATADGCVLANNLPDLVAIDSTTGAVTVLVENSGAANLAWSPDGRSIRWTVQTGLGMVAVRSIPATGGTSTVLAELPTFDPVWSPDRRQLAGVADLVTGDESTGSLWLADLDNGRVQRIASGVGASGSVIWPKWSSDGVWIAFERGPFDQTGGSHGGSIWIVHPDGSGLRQLVDDSFDVDLGTVDW